MDAAVELGRNPVSKHEIHPEYRDEQAEAGRDCRTSRETNSQARTRTGKKRFSVQRITSRIGNLTRLILTEKHEKLGYSPSSHMRCEFSRKSVSQGMCWETPGLEFGTDH